ncbi:CesT family type III secretion system chaperone [Ramlibacter sp. MAHUQ-53]|uniref:CesT family type III secretion system chaperone n=1 Tax=unclassified Ramlibacter TaxID=2617605 RepID=UPI00362CE70D
MAGSGPGPARIAQLLNEGFGTGASVTEDGVLHLQAHDGVAVAVSRSPDGEDLVLYAALAVLEGPRDVVRMVTALAFNLHQQETHGGAIGLDLGTRTLVYSWRRPIEGCSDELALRAVAGFCDAASSLAARLAECVAEFDGDELDELERRLAAHDRWFAGGAELAAREEHPGSAPSPWLGP